MLLPTALRTAVAAGGVEAGPGAVEPVLADVGELLAPLPQGQRLLQRCRRRTPAARPRGPARRAPARSSAPARRSPVTSSLSPRRPSSTVRRGPPVPAALALGHLGRRRARRAPSARCDDGVAAVQGRGRRQRAQPGQRVPQVAARRARAGGPDVRAARSRSAVDLGGPLPRSSRAAGPAPAGCAARRGRCCSRSSRPRTARSSRCRAWPMHADLLGQVGHRSRLAASVGRRGPHVGDVVDAAALSVSWPIARDHRRAAGEHRPAQRLVGERQQVLDAAAAPGHDDHVDRLVARRAPAARR